MLKFFWGTHLSPSKNFKTPKKSVDKGWGIIPSYKTHNILSCFENLNKITFLVSIQKWLKNALFLIFDEAFLNFCKMNFENPWHRHEKRCRHPDAVRENFDDRRIFLSILPRFSRIIELLVI